MSTLRTAERAEYFREYNRKRRPAMRQYMREYGRVYSQKIKLEVLTHYSHGTPVCASCGIDDIRTLCVDHVNGGGTKHLKQVGSGSRFYWWLRSNEFPAGYQVLCANCNMIKVHTNNECHGHNIS